MKNYLKLLVAYMLASSPILGISQTFFSQKMTSDWLEKAQTSVPVITKMRVAPVRIVKVLSDQKAYQGYKAEPYDASLSDFYQTSFKKQSGIILDFGRHLTGYYTFTLLPIPGLIPDAPVRLKFTFGEVPSEVATPFDPYTGNLSRAWLQDEVVTVNTLPCTITIPRRLAFRYLKIDVLGSSQYSDFRFDEMYVMAGSSETARAAELLPSASAQIRAIDSVGLNTYRECMQTVMEDGPKRDGRLWLGDLYVESMINYYSFRNYAMSRHCLYLLAALASKDGYLYSDVMEKPVPVGQLHNQMIDYELLFNVALKEYFSHSHDTTTALDLWPVALAQLRTIDRFVKDGIVDTAAVSKGGFLTFIDWCPTLDKQASLQGLMLYSMRQTIALGQMLGKYKEVSYLEKKISMMTQAARSYFYDDKSKLFNSGIQKQYSFASQIWMVLGGVVNEKQGAKALLNIENRSDAVKPGTPYMMYFYMKALLQTGLKDKAYHTLVNYWGGMVNRGADTFYEVYDPNNDFLSPYGFYPVNSYCHGWSATASYFIRCFPEIFQH